MKNYTSLQSIQADLYAGDITCRQLVEFYLQNITEKNTQLNAFLKVFDQEALAKADEIDQKIKAGTAGKLAGMVIGIKDLLCYKDHPSAAGSRILEGFESQFNATAVQRVIDADAIIIGSQNCDEFGMGSTNENSAYGACLNAVGESRVAGGSSGGSAVAVQADMCLASLGTDTGGSVRMPAGFCGLVGLKPTYTRVSRWGLIAYASSFDCIGPITKSVEDAAILLEIIAGKDEQDSTVSTLDVPQYSAFDTTHKTLKIGYLKEAVESTGLQPEVREATWAKLEALKAAGHVVEAVEFPLIKYFLPTYYILTTAEASSNLSRFDGVKYGHRSNQATDLMSMYKKSRAEGFGKEVKRRIMLGTFVLSASYYDAYYTKAQKVRRLIKDYTDQLLSEYDFLVCPTTPTTAYKIGEKTSDPIQMYLGDLFTVQANVVGLPAISIPNGVDNDGMPIGFQIMAGAFQEEALLNFAKSLY
ncbi:Asp-tRNA(Asn)/Glu-tRNA(Gln) amidotransferase subunit GatA [Flectobacillus rivi]|uniref:Glutamyl-tRNA(Gln) amidotransferase subunit A n=1 Tax=Flectobacillus rivi TaxID=2984209 RepID=A0ABT6Z3K5_9BACT|nr:Asp-tRNA(Asn)/Glu-tRNA(Gln) amidotransferase subunit GatA [Flectobacillus rivi]MDI9875703.1 Asp-tRNA(Asn)/Glu-tRNA(Gln) amidotransferase subunit GatA [Flectobacillus rivi]